MESLGELLQRMQSSSFKERSERLTGELMGDPLVREFRAEHPEVDERLLRINMSKLYQYTKDRRSCDNCPGLERCPNDFQGHYCKLTVEDINGIPEIVERRAPCALQLAWQREQQVRQRIRSFYVDERALKEGYNAVEIARKDLQRAPAVNQVFRYINEVKEKGLPTTGLYLEGSFGTGKTFLMGYLLHELALVGYTGVIVYMPDFVEDLKSMFQDGQKLKDTTDMLKNCDLLIFDDIGAENLSPWVRDHVLGSILNYRMNRKPTLYTSNYSLEGLEKHLSFTSKDGEEIYKGQRLMDRIRPFVDVVKVKGDNQRGGQ
ncbi:primosomal protein DnaI [Paenibacillus sp. JX-17]|uniref:Primosomal protein DnaI n=1 Tax=Paenibacillus lacisoli TaxID=3064525 RepID=A0ABT9CDV4_9BACL|nr:primosomal protein DnaI [Paenibacillus sp. JX-17]MDO7907045.1 primosomal protein DnaI [Paenibacillus sp. JX-17]